MLEPRRLAARNCATFIAKERGEAVGGTVGYQVRLERKISSATRLEVLTEGLLTNRIMDDPELAGIGAVIFDEFHERSLNCDLAYALALEVKRVFRPDLRIVVMSATLDADEVLASLGNASLIRAEGRMFPVETKYLGDMPARFAAETALKETDGDVLCFLPGEGEIRRALAAFPKLPGVEAMPLYGSLPKEEQDRVFRPSAGRKVVFSTSIAETSVTLEGVTAVVDSGLMRVPRFSPSTGMSGLVTLPLTQDRAEQRRGRAGRVRAGVCYRLWTLAEEASHPRKMMPEILDADLSSVVLTCAAWGALGRADLPWMTSPPASAWEQAQGLLRMLGALDDRNQLTDKGKLMAKKPMHPRLANMLEHPAGANVDLPLLAAIIEEGGRSRETDIRYVERSPRVKELAKRFARGGSIPSGEAIVSSEGAALALAYPDRVAKGRGNGKFTMTSGRGAFLPEDDPLAREPYLVCCELDDRQGDAKIFLAAPITENEIDALFGEKIVEEPYCEWDRRNERVKSVVRRKLGAMVMAEKKVKGEGEGEQRNADSLKSGEGEQWNVDSLKSGEGEQRTVEAMMEGVRQKGVENLPCWTKESLQRKARIAFLLKRVNGAESVPVDVDGMLFAALPGFIGGMNKWRDLEKLDLNMVLDAVLSAAGHTRNELDRFAPTRMEVPSGSNMTIHYEGAEPTVEVRLQECFGLMSTPKVANGTVPIVMTLLSPAQRPCAVTKDLANFWREGYPLVRKDLRGRYPKHYWPEDPFDAVATRRVRPRNA